MSKDTRSDPPDESDQAAATDRELDDARRTRVKARVLKSATGEMPVVRADQLGWREVLSGVQVKVLHQNPESGIQTALWKMAAGASIPAHPHNCDEECYIIKGSIEHRETRYHAGDFMLAPRGTRHATIVSPGGALMLIRGELIGWRERLLLKASSVLGR